MFSFLLLVVLVAMGLCPATAARTSQIIPVVVVGVPLIVMGAVRPTWSVRPYGRFALSLTVLPLYFVARTVSLPEQVVPQRNGIPWDIPWASLLLVLILVAAAVDYLRTRLEHPTRQEEPGFVSSTAIAGAGCVVLGLILYGLLARQYMMEFSYTLGMITKVVETVVLVAVIHSPSIDPPKGRWLAIVCVVVALARMVMVAKGGGA